MRALGFDSSVLSSFARAKRLDVLECLTAGYRRVATRAVLEELDRGCALYPLLGEVRTLRWLELVVADSLEELVAFSDYVRVLGSDDRNIGEASILAWAQIARGTVLIDDNAAVNAARSKGVDVRRSLALICTGVHRKALERNDACALVDELATAGGARFPCDGASFASWAEGQGLLASD